MSETRLIQAMTYLTDELAKTRKQMEVLTTVMKILVAGMDDVEKSERNRARQEARDYSKARKATQSDHERIAKFERYQAGQDKVDIPPIPAGPDRFA